MAKKRFPSTFVPTLLFLLLLLLLPPAAKPLLSKLRLLRLRRRGLPGGVRLRLHRRRRRHRRVPPRRHPLRGRPPRPRPRARRRPLRVPSLASRRASSHPRRHRRPDSPAHPFSSEDGAVPNARGRVLGGSSAINAGFYSRAHPSWFSLPRGPSWNMALVNDSYHWVERAITFRPVLRSWQSAVRDGLLEANVTPYNGFTVHHLAGTKIGATTFDSSGRRHSAADLLAFANPDRIRVALRATVDRVLLNPVPPGSRRRNQQSSAAIGVLYRDRLGRHHHAMVRPGGEVILCAGALGSPQLLLLSGVGPRPYLSSWGIPVAANLPDVGQHVYDNPRNGISIIPSIPLDHSLIQVVGIPTGEDKDAADASFLEAASNIVPFFSPPRSVFLHNPSSPLYVTVATLMEKVPGPASVGSLRLASLDARDNPIVRFNYFSNPEDLDRCVVGLRRVGDVLESRSMQEFRSVVGWLPWRGRGDFRYVGPALPANRSDRAAMEEFCRRTVATIWHYHGGCVAGKVVDGDYRVIGVGALRVVDGSTFAVSPGTNPQATLMMMGRYVGRKMLAERKEKSHRRRAPWPPRRHM
ncbi:(R)-mandelonitrile lyase-like [Ananas comosus]|uniref:(R)-mandelonitrile lyase-like n=1 Tax=Ananas comosus TaxID=4615 RepID=A0A199VG50_ANACO|nr:(R)-mandelonitrile lyase-like [Ananas comosus]